MDSRPKMIYLPDTMINWPWPRTINPHYEDVKAEIDASIRDIKALGPESLAAFDKCDTALLIALAYPNVPREHLRVSCDMMNSFLFVDEYTSIDNRTGVKEIVNIVIDALHNPHKIRPEGECILGEIMRQFWARAIQSASLSSQRHFLETYTAYLHGVAAEALDHEQGHRRSIDDYLKLRRYTAGLKPCLFINEMEMGLPDEVFYHPVIMDLAECTTNLVLIDNDMISYNKEQAANDDHNLVSIVMLELGLDISGAMAWAAHYHAEVGKRFIEGLAKVPSWGPSVDVLVKEYLDGMAMWARANHSWGYETQRYWGPTTGMRPEIQKTRLVPLLPRPDRKPRK
ncbi:isoprenoid synthase domain-containing protein [Suillus subalutaceus]|uniref:isoprenoid synthase domain-containing protein n=1 Tax=Suillus subalutaceus TaxID=48586 RepID=UPI001B870CC3|nr:isoprenoid synthase domain-containing protein [Suillus subalutaceus]KAG1843480.1 isoprenoid synthase domain-containing protein [Suillus subalutaceus]